MVHLDGTTDEMVQNISKLVPRLSFSQRGVCVSFGPPVVNLDTLVHLSFTCKCIVREQFGHPDLKFPANFDTLLPKPG